MLEMEEDAIYDEAEPATVSASKSVKVRETRPVPATRKVSKPTLSCTASFNLNDRPKCDIPASARQSNKLKATRSIDIMNVKSSSFFGNPTKPVDGHVIATSPCSNIYDVTENDSEGTDAIVRESGEIEINSAEIQCAKSLQDGINVIIFSMKRKPEKLLLRVIQDLLQILVSNKAKSKLLYGKLIEM